MYTIWRPYPNIKKSVETLPAPTLCRVGRLELTVILHYFAHMLANGSKPEGLDLLSFPSVQYYWNNGKPYLYDLLRYHMVAAKRWCSEGGEPNQELNKIRQELSKTQYAKNKAPWTKENATAHKLYLLSINHFWYKRFFRDLYMRRWPNPQLFKDGQPVEIKSRDIEKITIARQI